MANLAELVITAVRVLDRKKPCTRFGVLPCPQKRNGKRNPTTTKNYRNISSTIRIVVRHNTFRF